MKDAVNEQYRGYAALIFAVHGLNGECVPTDKGLFHHVFLSKKAVVRMPRAHKEHNFHGEEWAMDRARENGVPVPRVYAVDDSRTIVPVPYMLEERLPGENVWGGPNSKLSPKVLRNMGALLARIHESYIEGYGRINGNGVGRFISWRERMLKRHDTSLMDLAKINQSLAERVCPVYAELSRNPPAPHLLHGDFFAGNMLIKDDKITGVLDFNPAGGSIYFDLGNPAFLPVNGGRVEVEKGYGKKFDDNLIRLHMVDNIVGKIPGMMAVMPQRAEFLQKKLDEILKELRK